MRAAGRRYQETFRGRCKHAARQARYRARQREKQIVTHQGPPPSVVRAASFLVMTTSDEQTPETIECDLCGRLCLPFARSEPLRVRRRVRLTRLGRGHPKPWRRG